MGLAAPAFEPHDTQRDRSVFRPDGSAVIAVDGETSGKAAGGTGEAVDLKAGEGRIVNFLRNPIEISCE